MIGSTDVSHVLALIPLICLLKYHQHNIHNWGNNLLHELHCATEVIPFRCHGDCPNRLSKNVIIQERHFFDH